VFDWPTEYRQIGQQGVAEGGAGIANQQLSVQQLATVSDEALDNAYHYGRSQPGNTFGWQANLKSAAYAKQMIDKGVTDIEAISDAIHKGWNVTAQAFVKNPMQFDDSKTMAPEKLQAKIAQRQKLMTQNYAQLPEEEKEKDRVVARAMLQAVTGQTGVAEGQRWPDDRNSLSKNDRDIELINPKDADVKWKDRKIATKISPSITKTTVDRLDRNTTVPNFLKKKTKEDSTKGQVDEILGFQTAKPAAKKPTTSLSQMRKEFEKEPVAPQPKVVQSRDAGEKKAREVHKQYAEEDASGWPFKNGVDEDSWSDGQGQWSSEHDQWAHESLNEYPAAASVPADSSSAIPGTPGLNESQQQRLERLEIQWRLQEMKAAGYDL